MAHFPTAYCRVCRGCVHFCILRDFDVGQRYDGTDRLSYRRYSMARSWIDRSLRDMAIPVRYFRFLYRYAFDTAGYPLYSAIACGDCVYPLSRMVSGLLFLVAHHICISFASCSASCQRHIVYPDHMPNHPLHTCFAVHHFLRNILYGLDSHVYCIQLKKTVFHGKYGVRCFSHLPETTGISIRIEAAWMFVQNTTYKIVFGHNANIAFDFYRKYGQMY